MPVPSDRDRTDSRRALAPAWTQLTRDSIDRAPSDELIALARQIVVDLAKYEAIRDRVAIELRTRGIQMPEGPIG